MRHPFVILNKLIQKGFALVLLSILSIFYYVYSIAVYLFRYVAMVFAVIGFIMTAVDTYMYGFTMERLYIFLFLVGIVALRYLLPCLIPVMKQWQEDLTDCVLAPLTVRPPVRYTIY